MKRVCYASKANFRGFVSLGDTFVFGINHHQCGVELRSRFALQACEIDKLYQQADLLKITSLVILNTCNRMEIYGEGDYTLLLRFFISMKKINQEDERQLFIKTESNALVHLFYVVAGLDSQIIGDREILGQSKSAFLFAKRKRRLSGFFERLLNSTLASAKEIRNQTKLSNGTSSLSYALIQYLKNECLENGQKILLVGIGKFGSLIAKNVQDYLPNNELILCNRSEDKSKQLAEKLAVKRIDFSERFKVLSDVDIIITAASDNSNYLYQCNDFAKLDAKLCIDMAIPAALDPAICDYGHRLIDLNQLADLVNHHLEKRQSEIPNAQKICEYHIQEFIEWYQLSQKSEPIKEWKHRLQQKAALCPYLKEIDHELIHYHVKKSVSEYAKIFKKDSSMNLEREKNVIEPFIKIFKHIRLQKYQNETCVQNTECNKCQVS